MAKALPLSFVLCLLAALALAPSAQAGKAFFKSFGTPAGGTGGKLSNPAGLAVNLEGAGGVDPGDVYVADEGNNRISQFSAEGDFVRAFGWNVVASGPGNVPVNEKQTITIDPKATGGSFTLSFGAVAPTTTSALPRNATAAEVEAALAGLGSIASAANVDVTGPSGGPWSVEFVGTLADTNVNPISFPSAGLALTIAVGTQLTCTGGPTGGTGATTVAYQWLANGAPATGAGATTNTYTVDPTDAGKAVQCKVTATHTAGSAPTGSTQVSSQLVVSTPPGPLPTPPGGAINITGNATSGSTLTCPAGSWGNAPTSYTYQWVRNGTQILETETKAATSDTYAIQAADLASAATFQCSVTATNANGAATKVSSNKNTPSTPNPPGAPSPGAPVASASVPPLSAAVVSANEGSDAFEICEAGAVCKAGEKSTKAGGLSEPTGIAVDQANGNLYVTSQGSFFGNGNARIDVFSAEGAFEGAFGWNVNASAPAEEPQFCTTATGCKRGFVPSGSPPNLDAAGQLGLLTERLSAPAVDPTTGNLYIPDPGDPSNNFLGSNGNRRIAVYEPTLNGSEEVIDATFLSAFGSDVIPAINEKQTVTLQGSGAPGGTFTLSFDGQTTAPISATAAATGGGSVQNALAALPNVGTITNVDVKVAGSNPRTYTIEFKEALAGIDHPEMGCGSDLLTPAGATCAVATTIEGAHGTGTGFEVCTFATTCKEGTDGAFGGFDSPTGAAVDSAGNIYAAGAGKVMQFDPALSGANTFLTTANVMDVAVDPESDRLLVSTKIGIDDYRFREFNAAGAELDAYPPGEGLQGGSSLDRHHGLAFGTEERLYFSSSDGKVQILAPPPPPSATIAPVSNIGATSATFNGTVTPLLGNPLGNFPTSYHFEYSLDGLFWESFPAENVGIGDGSGSGPAGSCPLNNPPKCDVSQTVTGLQPGAGYQVRLVASNGAEVTSAVVVFKTKAAAPVVSSASATIGQTTATLRGRVNPNNQPSTYHFEWGADTSYGNRVPADFETFAGSGGSPIAVSANVSGLTPGATYHFRIVAESDSGATEGPDQQFTTLNAAGLPDNRGIELVSPPDKRPQGVVRLPFLGAFSFQAARDGESVAYPIQSGMSGVTAGFDSLYVASRQGDLGWRSEQISAPSLTTSDKELYPSVVGYITPDVSCTILESVNPLTPDVPLADEELKVVNLYRRGADGTFTLLTPNVPSNADRLPPTLDFFYDVFGSSADCSRVFFTSDYRLLPGASGLYEWQEGVGLRDAGLLPNGAAGSNAFFGAWGANALAALTESKVNSVADNGNAFFSATSNQGGDSGKIAVFVRRGPGDVVDASQKDGGSNENLGARYEIATPDGQHVFFAANYGLAGPASAGPQAKCIGEYIENTPDACDLYRYDVATGQLTDLSASTDPANTNGAVMRGVLDVSDDGSRAYFAAFGQLVPGQGRTYAQNLAGAGSANIYFAEGGSLTYVATVAKRDLGRYGDDAFTAVKGGNLVRKLSSWTAQATPSGGHLLFTSSSSLTTGYDSGGVPEAYLYDAGTGETVCVSCRPDGQPSIGNSVTEPIRSIWRERQNQHGPPRSLSDDGSRIFFTMPDVLAPGAVAGKANLYEWEEGQVYLLGVFETGGAALGFNSSEGFIDASADGDDVFIVSKEQLDPRYDRFDFVGDIYDLRIDGGFPDPAPEPIPCDPAADQCQGPVTPAPAAPNPPSQSFSGPGNPPAPQAKKKAKKKKKQKNRAKKHKRASHNRGGAK